MIKKNIVGKKGYEIPCIYNISGNEKSVVIISHGLGSSKESPTVKALTEVLESGDIAYIAYDFPGHGDSPVDGEEFLISNCIEDLAAVEAYAKKLLPKGEVMYFSSSFGAYINLLYLSDADKREPGNPNLEKAKPKSFLRAAAVNMPGIFRSRETPELLDLLDSQGYFLLEDGYFRPLKITEKFCQELYANDVFDKYEKGMAELVMIHGDEDESASYDDAVTFAEMVGARLITVKGGQHRLMDEGQMELVLDKAMEVFK